MAVRAFASSRIILGGTAEAMFAGAFTIVGLVKPDALAQGTYISFLGGGTERAGFGESSSGKPSLDTAVGSTNSGFVTMDAAVWELMAVTKASGSTQGKVHTKPLGSGSWEQSAGGDTYTVPSGTIDSIRIATNGDNSNPKDARIAWFAVFPRELSDAEVQSIDTAATSQNLVTLGATHLWHFNQASTATAVNDQIGTFNQTAIVGTTVDSSADPTWNYTVVVPPANTVAPALTGTAEVEQTLTCTQGTWSPAGDTYAYQWQANSGGGYTNISGATSSTFVLLPAQEGATVRCVVTATNAAASVSANSNATGTVAPAPPFDVEIRLSGGAANAAPANSFGGAKSSVEASTTLFDNVPRTDAITGHVEYRCVYIHNNDTGDTTVGAWISDQPGSGATFSLAVATEAAGVTVTAPANNTTAPSGPTFSTPTTTGAALALGTLTPGQGRGLWIRRTITAGHAGAPSNPWQITLNVNPL
jgi:hypothetical protein